MALILVVDDDEGMARLLEAILGAAGHRVVRTSDPRNVTKLFGQHSFDVVISDILMPRIGGVEMIQELRRMNPVVGLIAMSGAEPQSRKLFLDAGKVVGADAVFEKPFRREDLLRCVADALKNASQRKSETGRI